MYRLPSERVVLALDGPSVEVEAIRSWALMRLAVRQWAAYEAARTPDAELVALNDLCASFVAEAMPIWDIADHRGPIPATPVGMLRLPLELVFRIISGWLDTLQSTEEAPASAVDAIMPPGELRDELNRRLRAKRAA